MGKSLTGFASRIVKDKNVREMIPTHNTDKLQFFHTGSVALNLLLSGKVNGGIPCGRGLTMLGAPKAHGKTLIAMISSGNAQKKGYHIVWVDTEYAFDKEQAVMFGMSIEPQDLTILEGNKLEKCQGAIMKTFNNFEDGDKVMMVVDSLGTLVTSKTIDDAEEVADKADMTVAKKKNTLSKIILGISGDLQVPVILINHLYSGMSQYDTGVVSGGSGGQYASSTILKITSKSKEKKSDNTISGNIMSCIVDKGRFSQENSKLKFLLSYDTGINTYYGLLDDAMEGGYVEKPSVGFYSRPHIKDDKKIREKAMYTDEFWRPIFKDTDFKKYLEAKYSYKGMEEKVYNTTLEEL